MMCIEHRAQYEAQSKDSINVGYFGSVSKEYACNSGDTGDSGLILVSGRVPWRRKWQPTLVFLPEKIPRTGDPGWATVQRVAKSWTQLSD